ncbi:hypothetical protein OCK74_02300 [Chitinophagaceae bacterium LB-8]|uniref:6-phosphogluconate dehydrogenase n=1 Tax=Paraflavisolibacter caeni TaxID=2982496 RepID=A0A9X2XUF3_9BACT|nr:hypothetical protein [Paraflavisolibacter caeni]MCU7547923.1 hypothetical protein [Paraflavisolibacter caeni]
MESSELTVKRRKSKFGKYLTMLFIFIILGLGIYIYWNYFYTYSSGNRFGLLQKFSHKGNIFKTYEGEMILSSVRGYNNVPIASEKFFFSVQEKNVADQLMNMQGRYVTVHYLEKNGTLPWRGETKYIVDSVKEQ